MKEKREKKLLKRGRFPSLNLLLTTDRSARFKISFIPEKTETDPRRTLNRWTFQIIFLKGKREGRKVRKREEKTLNSDEFFFSSFLCLQDITEMADGESS